MDEPVANYTAYHKTSEDEVDCKQWETPDGLFCLYEPDEDEAYIASDSAVDPKRHR